MEVDILMGIEICISLARIFVVPGAMGSQAPRCGNVLGAVCGVVKAGGLACAERSTSFYASHAGTQVSLLNFYENLASACHCT